MEQLANGDFFKSKREERKERRWEYKQPRANSFLIVTAGDGTKSLYFRAIADRIKTEAGGNIRIVNIPEAELGGKGRGAARKLLARTEEIVSKANVLYQNIWIVFEKDDFDDFDWIILTAQQKGYRVAWNNQSFEYWMYLHFDYSDAVLSREDWQEKLKFIFRMREIGDGEYRKDDPKVHLALTEYGSLETAVKNGKQRMEQFRERYDDPSEFVPGLTLHLLAEQLLNYLPEDIKLEDAASDSPDAAENADLEEKPESSEDKDAAAGDSKEAQDAAGKSEEEKEAAGESDKAADQDSSKEADDDEEDGESEDDDAESED